MSSIISAIHHLKIAAEYFDDYSRQHRGTPVEKLFKTYRQKAEWIKTDLITHPAIAKHLRDDIRKEWDSDVFSLLAINEKMHQLNPEQREALEYVIDSIIAGESLTVEHIKEEV
jgi:hypothetical protein